MRSKNGFTLLELMIVVSIVAVIFTVAPTIFINITRFTRITKARLETQRGARDALGHINRTLRQAKNATVIVSKETNQPPCSSISFYTVDNRFMRYYQEGTHLKVVHNASTNTISENLRYIAFTHPRTDDSGIISVSVTFEKATYEGGSKALQMAIEKVRIMN